MDAIIKSYTYVGSTTMKSELRRVKTIVQAFAVAERQRDVTRSFSRNEHKQADQTSKLLEVVVVAFPLLALSSITPDVQTDEERSESHWRSTFCKAARSEDGSK